jgi:hypothetical protein
MRRFGACRFSFLPPMRDCLETNVIRFASACHDPLSSISIRDKDSTGALSSCLLHDKNVKDSMFYYGGGQSESLSN